MKLRPCYLLLSLLPFIAFACDRGSSSTHGSELGPSSTGGMTSMGGAGGATGDLIDDFEDGDLSNELGSGWYAYSDLDAAGASTVTSTKDLVAATGRDSSHALSFDYTLDRGDYAYDPFVGVGFAIPPSTDVSEYEGLSYYYKGAGHTVRFETSNVADYDFYVMVVPAAASWTKVTIPFKSLAQAGYGVAVDWDPKLLTDIKWHVVGADGSTGSLELDDVWFERTAKVDRGPKNLVVKPAAPPKKTVLGDITIDTPLEQKALAQLDRGYNLTNWLEAGRFQSFLFDETYIENLSKAGFHSVRLPIDLDLYVTNKTGTGDAMALTIDQDLWTILDSFDSWTKTYGLSLTIDYHQYDKSFGLSDTAGVDEAVALWKAVAAHFKANARDDIYFELLNEPELSTGYANGILPASAWTPVAQRMIDAIRAEDTTHTIIFGDVNWYGIDQLAERTPFTDDNIVYAFHSYEPFIFTHQGADWAQMGTTHDVPFPYTPERWSEYASDFGLTAAQPDWIWSAYKDYNVQGTVEAMYNRLAKAKAWAVKNQVPLICNEFGAYDRKSRLEDRVNYYTSLIGIFNELDIPWQVWFMIMSDDGKVIPEYVQAFGLDK